MSQNIILHFSICQNKGVNQERARHGSQKARNWLEGRGKGRSQNVSCLRGQTAQMKKDGIHWRQCIWTNWGKIDTSKREWEFIYEHKKVLTWLVYKQQLHSCRNITSILNDIWKYEEGCWEACKAQRLVNKLTFDHGKSIGKSYNCKAKNRHYQSYS